jgi:uncharacterized protein YqeY
MSIKDQLTTDLKAAMLAGDKELTTTLRGLKAAILSVEIAKGIRDSGLPDAEIIELFGKEAKRRQESADLFTQGGNMEKAAAELAEKKIIEGYLPTQLSDEELDQVVDQVIAEFDGFSQQQMGQAIGKVKAIVGASADGGRIAVAVKARLA